MEHERLWKWCEHEDVLAAQRASFFAAAHALLLAGWCAFAANPGLSGVRFAIAEGITVVGVVVAVLAKESNDATSFTLSRIREGLVALERDHPGAGGFRYAIWVQRGRDLETWSANVSDVLPTLAGVGRSPLMFASVTLFGGVWATLFVLLWCM